MKLNKKIENILENNGVGYKIYKQTNTDPSIRFYAECEYTDAPHGMDFVFDIECGADKNSLSECFINDFIYYVGNYDADDKATPYLEMWCKNNDDPKTHPPRQVLEDCDDCGKMLVKVAQELSQIKEG